MRRKSVACQEADGPSTRSERLRTAVLWTPADLREEPALVAIGRETIRIERKVDEAVAVIIQAV